ncbi:hypothetical protein K9O30_00250 [Clostridium bowmanii]|uniref:CsxC family protein n=1 Tax=Clostridium bowmanii TaxID=132925 RepID=UPI001C0B7349|nr:hypothetical protein [Clostridium bowmanii]MBU3188023.1 hypothetical protein [Clostridium bowmanii]MCA1072202.1 hypothetical protein [Clostridium bowmanii]
MEIKETVHPCDKCGEVSSQTLCLSDGFNIEPNGINGPLVVKVPVVLAQKNIQIDVESEIKLKEPFYEIKRIKKTVFLTQCKLLPLSGRIIDGVPVTGKLFISGYVRKNIEYATADCVDKKVVSGRIAHTTVDCPFTTVTEVRYVITPLVNTTIGDTTTFAETPFCELEAVRIIEDELIRDPICHPINDKVQLYNKIVEKMVVYINVKVLQVQQVNIPGIDTFNSCDR